MEKKQEIEFKNKVLESFDKMAYCQQMEQYNFNWVKLRDLRKELRNCDDEEEKQDIEDEMNDIKVMIGYLKEGLGIKTNN